MTRPPLRMPPPMSRRLASVFATFKLVPARGGNALLLPLGRRISVVRFAWRHGVRNPGSVWDRHLRDEQQHITVYSN